MCLQYKSLKTQWEKVKLLITSNFYFFRSVFHPFGKLSTIYMKSKIAKSSGLEESKICCLGKG